MDNFQRVGQSTIQNMLEEEQKIHQLQDREISIRQLGTEDLVTTVQMNKEIGLFERHQPEGGRSGRWTGST